MRSERTPNARRYWAALFLVVLAALLGVWHSRRVDRGQTDYAETAVRGVVAPPATVVGRMSRWFSNQTGWITHGRSAMEENRQLKARVAELEGENALLREFEAENVRLRANQGFVARSPNAYLAADVVARRPNANYDTILINRGSQDGVHPHSVVVTRDGLVGQVTDVTWNTASVALLTDHNLDLGVGAVVQRAGSRATGVCKGNNGPFLSMINLPGDADIKPSDVIVTSGMGGVYPAGLIVGTVKDAAADEGKVNKTARILPKVDFDRLEEVYVLK